RHDKRLDGEPLVQAEPPVDAAIDGAERIRHCKDCTSSKRKLAGVSVVGEDALANRHEIPPDQPSADWCDDQVLDGRVLEQRFGAEFIGGGKRRGVQEGIELAESTFA